MKILSTLLAGCALVLCGAGYSDSRPDLNRSIILAKVDSEKAVSSTAAAPQFNPKGFAGSYLAGLFAQHSHDWDNAHKFISKNLALDSNDTELMRRAMVIALGSGNYDTAFSISTQVSDQLQKPENSTLSLLFQTIRTFQKDDYETALKLAQKMEKDGIADFIQPLIESWALSASGELKTDKLQGNSVHLNHAVMISFMLKKYDETKALIALALSSDENEAETVESFADMYSAMGEPKKALELYNKILEAISESKSIAEKIKSVKDGKTIEARIISSPKFGLSEGLYDMARILYQDFSDESARVFSHMALYLNPKKLEPHLLLASIASRNERYNEAITHYQHIPENSEFFIYAQREIATLYEQSGRSDESIATLELLAGTYKDMNALIQIGDIYRSREDFTKSILMYNRAEEAIGADNIIPDYWNLYYARGMAYERIGEWEKAEYDLERALDYEPDHPYLLNYLGYAWADRGENLVKALEMIKKAVSLRPQDGYITDSLGWVLYKKGDYEQAVIYLEKAAELEAYDAVINDHLGDAYWKVGRKIEAKFQWQRARNHAENDQKLIEQIDKKLLVGLDAAHSVQEASSNVMPAEEIPARDAETR